MVRRGSDLSLLGGGRECPIFPQKRAVADSLRARWNRQNGRLSVAQFRDRGMTNMRSGANMGDSLFVRPPKYRWVGAVALTGIRALEGIRMRASPTSVFLNPRAAAVPASDEPVIG